MKIKREMTTTRVIALGFLITILVGTLLLMLPFSTASGEHTSILEALFTSTTSVCVTGLVVVDTFSHWSLFGKIIILILIQIGGLGIISIFTLLMHLLRRKFTLKNSMLIQDSYNLNTKQDLKRFTLRVFKGTISIEILGTLLYSITFCQRYGFLRGLWYSLFNSVSAFCNAGIDLLGNNSLMDFAHNPLVMFTTCFLIITGGLGFVVWWDIIDVLAQIRLKDHCFINTIKKINLQTKLVLLMTILLIVSGTVFIYLMERNNPLTIGDFSECDKWMNSFFQSVTFRTAGFYSFPQEGLYDATALFGMTFMFIGGSPVGTAGGVKTVTIAVVFLNFMSAIRDRNDIVVFKRKIPNVTVKKAVTILFISMSLIIIMTILLLITNDYVGSFVDCMFEVVSAIGTVGLSRGLTASLNTIGRIIIIICMYLGRIGPISMTVALSSQNVRKNLVHYPEENIIVG
ncbi:MAG: TrkH family potassium uptake protein [Coprococcus sp.]